jgi:hypothetical protein
MSIEHGRKFAERVKRKNSENNLSQRGFVHYKYRTERVDIEPGPFEVKEQLTVALAETDSVKKEQKLQRI